MSLVILTKSPVLNFKDFIRHIKSFIKFLLGQKRGPDVVVDSLLKGLKELNFDFKFNISANEIKPDDIVYINGSLEALKWAIEAKKKGKIKKLIVGPVMVVVPSEKNGIIMGKAIDVIIVPSLWVKNLWVNMNPELSDRIVIWPAGIDETTQKKLTKERVIIYAKNCDEKLLSDVRHFLAQKKVSVDLIKYGYYRHDTYLDLLDEAKFMIYFSPSESQGLALAEAWEKNVPTLVWNRGYWQYNGISWKDEKISAPYLTKDCGIFFKDINEFQNNWLFMSEHLEKFNPRQYVIENFSHRRVAENFVNLIKL